ncbi:RNA polymerase sigma-70 factor [Paludibacter sp. 221]|uniref:RNA polymerase sigma-70 factor n=1 Tax=Paludibacter sp. 221 TaxID=2302939 RepID=UPI0013CFD290|nr:RNA polymerase sigma-70 factor [Paludibacter sp. 221]NDV45597.1 RNA polymerase sigma-70 factor [Paludibacter sp. 221]
MQDKQLIEKIRLGDMKAFRLLFDNYYALMCAVAYEYVRDDHASRNIADDVMLNVWEKRKELEISVSIKSYLLRAVRNRSIDFIRKNKSETSAVNYDEIQEKDCFTPDEELFERILLLELQNKINDITDTMPPETRKVFMMSRYEDKTYNQIAEELNISINTVKYHIKQALGILRSGLKEFLAVTIAIYFHFFY